MNEKENPHVDPDEEYGDNLVEEDLNEIHDLASVLAQTSQQILREENMVTLSESGKTMPQEITIQNMSNMHDRYWKPESSFERMVYAHCKEWGAVYAISISPGGVPLAEKHFPPLFIANGMPFRATQYYVVSPTGNAARIVTLKPISTGLENESLVMLTDYGKIDAIQYNKHGVGTPVFFEEPPLRSDELSRVVHNLAKVDETWTRKNIPYN